MARNVQVGVTAKLGNLQGGAAFVRSLQRQLRATSFTINIGISRNSSQAINGLTARLNNYSKAAQIAATRTTTLASAVQNLSNIFSNFAINAHTGVAALKQFNTAAKGTSTASKHIQTFSNRFELLGDRVALSAKRLGAFMLAFRPLMAISNAIGEATTEAIQFQDQMVRLSQITGGATIRDVSALSKQIQGLAVQFGVASKDITGIADTFLQAGLKANEVRLALEAVTKVALAPTFDSIEQAGEGLIAMMGQFNIPAEQFGKRLSQINTLSAKYAAESSDYIAAIRKSGAAFAGAGGNLEELMALFTAVRDSSRESADTISTSFRTIFARLQRPGTVNFLEQLGIQLRDVKGNFVGPFQAVLNIADKLSKINPQSQLFAQIVEEIGGIRQVNKVQTLLSQTAKAREALSVAQNAGNSIDEDADKRQQSLIVNLTRLNEAFKNLFKTLATDDTFTATANSLLKLATSAVQAVESIAPLIPLIAGFSALSITKATASVGLGAYRRFKTFASGGVVPGSGNRDSEMAMLMPGEFVVNKKAVQAIGVENLHRLNEGQIGKYARGTPRRKPKTYSSFQEMTKDVVDQMPRYSDETKRRIAETLGVTGRRPPRRAFEIGGQSFATGGQMASAYGSSDILTDQLAVSKKQNEIIEEEIKIREKAIKSTKMGSDAIKAEARENERLARNFGKSQRPLGYRYLSDDIANRINSTAGTSMYSNDSYWKMRNSVNNPGTQLVPVGAAFTSTTRGTTIPPPPTGPYTPQYPMTRYTIPLGRAPQTHNLLPNPYAGLTGPVVGSTHPMFDAVPISSRPTPRRSISMQRRFNRLRSRFRAGRAALNSGLGFRGNLGLAASLGGIAAAGALDQNNPLNASLTSALSLGGGAFMATGNPLIAAAAAGTGAALGFTSTRRNNRFNEKFSNVTNVFEDAKLNDLSGARTALGETLIDSSRVSKFNKYLGYRVRAAFGPENAQYNYDTLLEEGRGKARGARLREMQPELEKKATAIENKIKELSARGFTKEQIGRQVDLKNAAFIVGAARTSNTEQSTFAIEKEGRKLTQGMIEVNQPMSKLAKAMQEMAQQVDNDRAAFEELANNLEMASGAMALVVNDSKVLAGGLGVANVGGAGSNLDLALNGNLNNVQAQKALSGELGLFGATGQKLANQLIDTDISQKILGDIFSGKLQGISETTDIDTVVRGVLKDFEEQFTKATGRRVDPTVRRLAEVRLEKFVADSDTTANLKIKAGDPGFAKSLFQDIQPENDAEKRRMLESIQKFGDQFVANMDEITTNLDKRFETVQKGISNQVNTELLKRQFDGNSLVDVGLSQQVFMQGQQGLLGRAGINANPLDAVGIVAGRDALRQRVRTAQDMVSTGPPEDRLKNIEELKKLNDALAASEKAVSNLTDNIDELNKGPLERLAQIGQEKNARLGFGEKLLGGNATDAMRQLQRILAAQGAVAQGNFNNMNPMQRRLALEGLNDMSGMRINGRLVDEIKADLIKNSLPGLIPKDLEAEEKNLQKQVIDNMGIQAAALNANIASLDMNTQALADNSVTLQNMVIALQNRPAGAGFAMGGRPKGTDTVPAMLTPGEFVINRRATEKFLPLLHKINSGALDVDDVQYAARGRKILPRHERMAIRRGLNPDAFGRSIFRFGNQRAPIRELDRFKRIRNFGNNANGLTRYSRAAQRRIARQGRLAMRGYADGGVVDGGGGGVAFDAAAISQFVSASAALTQALNNIPREISLVGSYNVNIIHNGLDIVGELQPMVQRMVDEGLSKANKSYRGPSGDTSGFFNGK